MTKEQISSVTETMMRVHRLHRATIDARVKEIGIHRTQHRILMRLARFGSLPSQKELAEHLDITPAAVTGALKKIEQDGYIERTLGHDTRYNEIRITEKGMALVERTRMMFSETDTVMFDGFSDEELSAYASSLEKILENIRRSNERREENEKMV